MASGFDLSFSRSITCKDSNSFTSSTRDVPKSSSVLLAFTTSYVASLSTFWSWLNVKKALINSNISFSVNDKANVLYSACKINKIHTLPYNSRTSFVHIPLQVVHPDVWVLPLISKNVITFSCFTWIYFLRSKSNILQAFCTLKMNLSKL